MGRGRSDIRIITAALLAGIGILATACGGGEQSARPSEGQPGQASDQAADQSPDSAHGGTPEGQDGDGTENPEEDAGKEAAEKSGENNGKEEDAQMNGQDDYKEIFKGISITESYKGLNHTNPLMTQSFGADPFAMVYEDRVYLYMTGDNFAYDGEGNVTENTYANIQHIRILSTEDMVNFTDHGAVNVAASQGAAKWANNSWAPAAAWKEIDGKPQFFLYFADAAGGIGVLQADSPTGPFKDPLGHALITRQTPNCEDVTWLFDPAVLVDEDGRAYLYFGGGIPEGKVADPGTARAVELGEDMISIQGEPVRLDVPYLFEDSGIHKSGGKYYYTYCSNWQVEGNPGFRSAEIVSMESDSPLGPFVLKEPILENPGAIFGLYGNNHHCVFQFQGNWYITYHTRVLEAAMGVEQGYRSTHIDEFTMGEDGSIGYIAQTLQGPGQIKSVNPYEKNRAVNMAAMGGVECVPSDGGSRYYGCGNMALGGIDTGDFVEVRGVDFGAEGALSLTMTVRTEGDAEGVVKICLDSPEGEAIGYLPVRASGEDGFAECSAQVETVDGVHDLFFVFQGTGYEVEEWWFESR